VIVVIICTEEIRHDMKEPQISFHVSDLIVCDGLTCSRFMLANSGFLLGCWRNLGWEPITVRSYKRYYVLNCSFMSTCSLLPYRTTLPKIFDGRIPSVTRITGGNIAGI